MRTPRDVNLEAKIKRRLVRERGERCEVCGWQSLRARLRRGYLRVGAMLQMHHVTPVGSGGMHEDENLVLLCPNHHTMVDEVWGRCPRERGPGKVRRAWRGPASRRELIETLRQIEADPEGWYRGVVRRIQDSISRSG